MQLHGGQGAGIDERNARTVREVESGASIGRRCVIDPTNVPITGHPEMHVK